MNVALIGYGKIGKEIEKILIQRGHKIVLIIDENNPLDLNAANIKEKTVDVAIEFSTPASAYNNLAKCIESGVPVVCGTTGWTEKLDDIKAFCKKHNGSFFYASNYSVGVNVMFKINEILAKLMNDFPGYDVTVEEVHHVQKKDAPSGTAITIAQGIVDNLERKSKWVGNTTTEPDELEVLAVRRGVAPGTHIVTYESEADIITVSHNAKNRSGFALGAVMAAEYIVDKKGVYSMSDMLGF